MERKEEIVERKIKFVSAFGFVVDYKNKKILLRLYLF